MTNHRRYLDNLDADVIKSHVAALMTLAETNQPKTILNEVCFLVEKSEEFERDFPERTKYEEE